MTVSRYAQLTVHKYGQEARLGPRFQFICKVQEVVMDKCEDGKVCGTEGDEQKQTTNRKTLFTT